MALIPSDTILRTPEGLVQAQLLDGRVTIWNGSAWADAEISSAEKVDIVEFRSDDGGAIQLTPDARVLTAGSEQYEWKRVTKLKTADRVCMSLGDGRRIMSNDFGTIAYWQGVMFGAGVREKNKFEFEIQAKDINEKLWMSKSVEAATRGMKFGATTSLLKRRVRVVCRGSRFKRFLGENGVWFDVDGKIERIPPKQRLKPGKARRAFAKGVIDSIGQSDGRQRSWYINLGTESRARDFHTLLRSVGVASRLSGDGVTLKKWIAAYSLNTSTDYPTNSDLTAGGGLPCELVDEFLCLVEERLRIKHSLGVGIARYLVALIREDPGVTIYPLAMRSAWRQLNASPRTPVFDDVRPVSVMPTHEKQLARQIEILDTDHRFDANGYVISDSIR